MIHAPSVILIFHWPSNKSAQKGTWSSGSSRLGSGEARLPYARLAAAAWDVYEIVRHFDERKGMYIQTEIMKQIPPSAVTSLDVVWRPSELSRPPYVDLSGAERLISQ